MKKIVLSLVLSAFGHHAASAAVIYRNNFGNNEANATLPLNHANVGWKALRATIGGNIEDQSSAATAFIGVTYFTGRTTDQGNVNAPLSLSDATGLAFLSNATGPKYTALFYTDHYLIDRSLYQLDSMTWEANATNGPVSRQRIAVQVNSQWYVSQEFIPNSGNANNFATTASSHSLNFGSATWYSFTASLDAPFSIGGSAPLPEGDITAFGIYLTPSVENHSNYVTRFDTYTINATMIPEPSSIALLFGAAGLVGWARKGRWQIAG